ncbi:DUF1064 domain-containing protein [Stenotrophomonas acidaminiphila]|uniref:DUF1064 domain-containing protein n=1 Tax=Stenotrophomonas acidaminiphila TaxID=128780 RepID=UPI0028B0DB35|nr:DUF1064 domain-containing protein [Stenotrophomonas acidaminiphila]
MSNRSLRFNRIEDMPEGMRALFLKSTGTAGQAEPPPPAEPTKRAKYGNTITVVDGIRFDSKKEARYYEQLKVRRQAGEVHFWLRQVPVHLPGGTKYVLDFLVFLRSGEVQFVDVKGRETKEFRIKKREVEHHYPIRILLA